MVWNNRWFQYFVLLFLALIWGSSFILMKIGLRSFSAVQAAAIRIVLSSLVLLPWSVRGLKKIRRQDLKYLLITGFVGSLIPAFLFTKAQTRIDSAMAGMLNSLTPVFTLIVGIVFYKTKTRKTQILGLIFGLGGAVGLIISVKAGPVQPINSYALLVVLATICYAVNVNLVKNFLTHLRGLETTSVSMFFIGPAALLILLTTDLGAPLSQFGWGWHFAALAALGIVGTAMAMLIMYSLIRYTSAIFASSVTYIIPGIAILWGVFDGEVITLGQVLFMLVVLAGVYLINKQNRPA